MRKRHELNLIRRGCAEGGGRGEKRRHLERAYERWKKDKRNRHKTIIT